MRQFSAVFTYIKIQYVCIILTFILLSNCSLSDYEDEMSINISRTATSVQILSNNNILISGIIERSPNQNDSIAIFLLDQNGLNVTNFANDGIMIFESNSTYFSYAQVEVLENGNFILLSCEDRAHSTIETEIFRFNSIGDLDKVFGNNGRIALNLSYLSRMHINTNGKIIIGGRNPYTNDLQIENAVLIQLTPEGNIDQEFNSGNRLEINFDSINTYFSDVAYLSNDRIIMAGFTSNNYEYDFAIACFHSNGEIDSTFGIEGKIITDVSGDDDKIKRIAVQPDGKIVAAGKSKVEGSWYNYSIARYNPDGFIDESFGTGGISVPDVNSINSILSDIHIFPNGNILLVGSSIAYANDPDSWNINLAMLSSDGTLDLDFGNNGYISTDIYGGRDMASSVAIQSDNKIVVVGITKTTLSNGDIDSDFLILKYNIDGSLDSSFGQNGILIRKI